MSGLSLKMEVGKWWLLSNINKSQEMKITIMVAIKNQCLFQKQHHLRVYRRCNS